MLWLIGITPQGRVKVIGSFDSCDKREEASEAIDRSFYPILIMVNGDFEIWGKIAQH